MVEQSLLAACAVGKLPIVTGSGRFEVGQADAVAGQAIVRRAAKQGIEATHASVRGDGQLDSLLTGNEPVRFGRLLAGVGEGLASCQDTGHGYSSQRLI